MASRLHLVLQRLHILPGVFRSLPPGEQAFVVASCRAVIKAEQDALRGARSGGRARRATGRR